MNINLQISSTVPDFFRKIKRNSLKANQKLPSVDDFVKSKIGSEHLEQFADIIDLIIKNWLTKNQLMLPVYLTNGSGSDKILFCNNTQYLLYETIDDENTLKSNIYPMPKSYSASYSVPSPHMYINLFDSHFYDITTDVKLTQVPLHHITEAIKINFGYEIPMNYFIEHNFFKAYSKLVSLYDEQLELQLYDAWVKHNVELLGRLQQTPPDS